MLPRIKTKVVSKIVPQNLATWRAIALPFKRKLSFLKAHYLAVTVKEDLNKGNALVRRGLISKKLDMNASYGLRCLQETSSRTQIFFVNAPILL